MIGLSVRSVPVGLDSSSVPVGLQIVGRPRGEEGVLALAAEVQRRRWVGRPALL